MLLNSDVFICFLRAVTFFYSLKTVDSKLTSLTYYFFFYFFFQSLCRQLYITRLHFNHHICPYPVVERTNRRTVYYMYNRCCFVWWHISVITCQIIMLTCKIFMLTWPLFLSTCPKNMPTTSRWISYFHIVIMTLTAIFLSDKYKST